MKRIVLVYVAILLCILLVHASADRYINSDDCENMNDFLNAIEMGTTITANGYVYIAPYKYEMDKVEGYCLNLILDIKGCVEQHVFLMISEEQKTNIEAGDYISVSGKMFSRGNTGKNYYFNTQLDGGYVEKKKTPEHIILDLNEEKYDMVSVVKQHRIGDIAKGEGLTIISTDEWTYSSDTTYYYYVSLGNLIIRFHTNEKDLFKGDVIDLEAEIYNYDEPSKLLLCRNPIYQLHENK